MAGKKDRLDQAVKLAKLAFKLGKWNPAVVGGVASVVAGVIVLGLVIVITVGAFVVLCNPDTISGYAVKLTVVPDAICDVFSSGTQGVVSTAIERAGIRQPPVDGGSCPNVRRPPKVTVLRCLDCADLKQTAVTVKQENTNSLINRAAAEKLVALANVNDTFRVTEAFCPTAYHSDPKHYNGLAVDVNLKPEFAGDKEKLAKLYRDARAVGFEVVICEYPIGFLKDFNINCRARRTTTAPHLHLEVAGPDFLSV